MPQFRFRVLTPDGRERGGRFTGNSLEEARRQIEESGLKVLDLTPLEEPGGLSARKRNPWRGVSGYQVAAALACWGLVWGVLCGFFPISSARPARDVLTSADKRFKAEFLGRWDHAAPAARLIYRFPEIPYQVESSWSGQAAKIEFVAARQPTYCLVELRNRQGLLASARIEPILPKNEYSMASSKTYP